MDASLGRITARLAEKEEQISSDLIDLINGNINPPSPVGPDDVHIRTMFIVSDRVNSFGGRFPVEEHARLAELLVDSPVLVGHRKDRLPVGRNFHAVTVEKDGHHWVKSFFYWLKSAEGAANLKENIDGGIYKECSIGFTFLFPECSICGKDIRFCEHEPLQSYRQNGQDNTCFFNYRQIERVLETSLVYRGALPDTEISRELKMEKVKTARANKTETVISLSDLADPGELADNGRFLIIPRYESLPVEIHPDEKQPRLTGTNGRTYDESFAARFPFAEILKSALKSGTRPLRGRLVGYRGKERCSVGQLEQFIAGNRGPVSRVVLLLFPDSNLELSEKSDGRKTFEVRPLPYRYAFKHEITERAAEITTRSGVEIWPLENDRPSCKGYLYRPESVLDTVGARYSLTGLLNTDDVLLRLDNAGNKQVFSIRNFNRERLARGRRFITDKIDDAERSDGSVVSLGQGKVEKINKENDALIVSFTGYLAGEYVIRPVRLEGRPRLLFYRLTGS